MPILTNAVIQHQRHDLLAKVEAFAYELLRDFERRKADQNSFWQHVNFCSPMVMDLVAWERIHAVDLVKMPSVKALFIAAAKAAHNAVSNYGRRDPEFSPQGRRTFDQICEAELAANILPRLQHILQRWGISNDPVEGTISERSLTEQEENQLTRYYGGA